MARNEKFRALVSAITQATFKNLSPKFLSATNLASCDFLMSDSILNVEEDSVSGNVADRVAAMVGHLQEKITVPRGCTLSCTEGLLCAHIYNNSSLKSESEVEVGTYGTVLHMISEDGSEPLTTRGDVKELKLLGERVCQHIVGVSPFEEGLANTSQALLAQRFLFDDTFTVGELLQRNGVSVTRFIRYALGETATNSWSNA